jgi:hypothetical protein
MGLRAEVIKLKISLASNVSRLSFIPIWAEGIGLRAKGNTILSTI